MLAVSPGAVKRVSGTFLPPPSLSSGPLFPPLPCQPKFPTSPQCSGRGLSLWGRTPFGAAAVWCEWGGGRWTDPVVCWWLNECVPPAAALHHATPTKRLGTEEGGADGQTKREGTCRYGFLTQASLDPATKKGLEPDGCSTHLPFHQFIQSKSCT